MAVITTLSVVAGVQSHITIGDANAADAPIPNANVSIAVFGGATGLAAAPNPAGGFFVTATTPGTGNLIATYHNGSLSIDAPALPVTVSASIMPEYLSP